MCWSHHHHRHHRDAWERAEARREEPIVPEPLDLRASDAERERVVEVLRAHAAEGRLSADELEQRLGRAYAAQTRADLKPLTADLPGGPRPAPERRARRGPREEVRAYLAVAIVLLAIWALTGAGAFWPAWPLGFWGFALVMKTQHRPRRRHDAVV